MFYFFFECLHIGHQQRENVIFLYLEQRIYIQYTYTCIDTLKQQLEQKLKKKVITSINILIIYECDWKIARENMQNFYGVFH